MQYSDVIIISLIVILLLLIIGAFGPKGCWPASTKKEGFNAMGNQDEGAFDVYTQEGLPVTGAPPSSIDEAALYARYAWNDRDKNGWTVYDKVYSDYNSTIGNANDADPEYAYRDINSTGESDVYDTKFERLDTENRLASYAVQDMKDKHPARYYNWEDDEESIAAQKNY